jgi:hypothetical protein
MAEPLFALRRFYDAGGPILGVIFLVAVVLWMLIIERYWYHWRLFPRELAALHGRWWWPFRDSCSASACSAAVNRGRPWPPTP